MVVVNCTQFFPIPVTETLYYTTNIILVPLLFGLGSIGNAIILVLANCAYLREQSPIYVYITGLAIVDLFVLILTIPFTIRDFSILPPAHMYSHGMIMLSILDYSFRSLARHSGLWICAVMLVVRYLILEDPWHKRPYARITTNRIVAFITVLFCAMVDFGRFFELLPARIVGGCFATLEAWTWQYTDLAKNWHFGLVYHWLNSGLGQFLPLILMCIFGRLIYRKAKVRDFVKKKLRDSEIPSDNPEMDYMLLVTALVVFLCELPSIILEFVLHFTSYGRRKEKEYHPAVLITSIIVLIHISCKFIVYMSTNGAFRTMYRRVFCCGCVIGDEYYEPCACLPCKYRKVREPGFVDEKERNYKKKLEKLKLEKERKRNEKLEKKRQHMDDKTLLKSLKAEAARIEAQRKKEAKPGDEPEKGGIYTEALSVADPEPITDKPDGDMADKVKGKKGKQKRDKYKKSESEKEEEKSQKSPKLTRGLSGWI